MSNNYFDRDMTEEEFDDLTDVFYQEGLEDDEEDDEIELIPVFTIIRRN